MQAGSLPGNSCELFTPQSSGKPVANANAPPSMISVMHCVRSSDPCLTILLDMYVLVCFEGVDDIVGEFHAAARVRLSRTKGIEGRLEKSCVWCGGASGHT